MVMSGVEVSNPQIRLVGPSLCRCPVVASLCRWLIELSRVPSLGFVNGPSIVTA